MKGDTLLRKVFAEPLLHFFVIALGFFLLYRAAAPDDAAQRRISVTSSTIQSLTERFTATWQRAPTPAELRRLTEDYVKEEILYRQGVSMGLDLNDEVIKRRVLQKVQVISEEASASNPPTDTELEAYLKAHAEKYATLPRFTLEQVLFDPGQHPDLDSDLAQALKKLKAGADPNELSDTSLVLSKLAEVTSERLARDFGKEFVEAIKKLPVGDWQGPVRSGVGVHLVRVKEKLAGHPARLGEVRAAVERDWERQRRERARDDYYENLRKTYTVEIEAPSAKAAP